MEALVKVLYQGKEIVYRDFIINLDITLDQFHKAIIKSFELKGDELAHFTKVDDEHDVEVEYHLEALDETTSLMKDVKVDELIKSEGDDLIYTYDLFRQIQFVIETLEISDNDDTSSIKEVKRFGPELESVLPDDNEDAEAILREAIYKNEFEDEEDEDLFDSGDFDSIDDYEEFQ